MSNLKELTWEHHKNAERQLFVKELLSGEIKPERYAEYLYNQYLVYNELEGAAASHGLFADIESVKRTPSILKDFNELWVPLTRPIPKPCTIAYIEHIKSISDDKDKLMAHIYVRHMGDLSGGQMIAKRVPGSRHFYQFSEDVPTLKEKIRSKLDDSMADEAKICFDFAAQLFLEMTEN